VEETRLPNGLRILTERLAFVDTVNAICWLRGGSRSDPHELAGRTHFIEHLLFSGTRSWPSNTAISEAVEGRGGDYDAATYREFLRLQVRIGAGHLDLALRLLAELVRQPLFAAEAARRELGLIKNELEQYRDLPEIWTDVILTQALLPGHPLGASALGDPAALEALSADDLRRRWEEAAPSEMILQVVGAVDHQDVVSRAAALLGDWAGGPGWRREPAGAEVRPATAVTEASGGQLLYVGLGWRAASRRDRLRHAWKLCSTLLTGGLGSLAYQRLRTDKGLVYEIVSDYETFADDGVFRIIAGTDPEAAPKVVAELMRCIGGLCRIADGSPRLQRAKEYYKGRLALRLESVNSYAKWVGRRLAAGDDLLRSDQETAAIDAVGAAEVRRVAAEMLEGRRLCLGLNGPEQDKTRLGRCLETLARSSPGYAARLDRVGGMA